MLRLDRRDVTNLCVAIVEQAMSDYSNLKAKKKDIVESRDSGTYSKAEIEEFFNSDWAAMIIEDGLGFKNMTGEDFLRSSVI